MLHDARLQQPQTAGKENVQIILNIRASYTLLLNIFKDITGVSNSFFLYAVYFQDESDYGSPLTPISCSS